MANIVKVLKPGLSTTIQDLGRTSHQIEGFPESGAIDRFEYQLANMLVNNHKNDASLEFVMTGPSLQFECDSFVALTGGQMHAKLNGQEIPKNQAIKVNVGDVLECGPMITGNYGYIAFANGGIVTQPVLDSRSTTLRTQMGGIQGRALLAGDNLPIRDSVIMPSFQSRKIDWEVETTNVIRFVRGPHWTMFSDEAQQQFTQQSYRVSEQMDRMGYRLNGQSLPVPSKNLLSEGTVFGNIQVTRDGSPIVLLADRQTTGGYPVIGTIIRADWSKFVQLQVNSDFHFVEVDMDTAMSALIAHQKILNDTYEKWYRERYREPIGPLRRNSIKIEQLIRRNS